MSGSAGPTIGVVFAGGGTGGHIHPGLAIAERLESRLGERFRAVFVVSDRAIDQRVLDSETLQERPIERVISPAKPMILRPKPMARFVWSWGGGVRAAREAVRSLSRCDRVAMVATGGFVSAPAVFGARAEGIERWVIDLDAVPGKANRLAARCATRRYAVGTADRSGVKMIPPIVRRRVAEGTGPATARSRLELEPEKPTLLITGGSQGAATVNGFAIACANADPALLEGWQVIHQTGPGHEASSADAWAALGIQAETMAYVDRMDLALAAADAAICRGGAGAVADLWATRTPALILPYPYHKDEHQRRNAEPLASAGCALILRDLIDPAANTREHYSAWQRLFEASQRAEMARAFDALGPADGADHLADEISMLGAQPNG